MGNVKQLQAETEPEEKAETTAADNEKLKAELAALKQMIQQQTEQKKEGQDYEEV